MKTPLTARRSVLAGFAVGGLALAASSTSTALAQSSSAAAPALAVTIDDFNMADGPLLSGERRHAAILAALDRHRVKAAGFPAGRFVDSPDGTRRLAAWAEQGHLVCNHTYTHPNYNSRADPAAMMADVLRAEPLLMRHRTFAKLFRFPYLAEGRTAEVRDGMRALLAEHDYRNGYVTTDTSDWYVSGRLAERVKHEPNADLAPYRRYYLAHLLDRAIFYDRLARDVLGNRTVPHTILLHHNLASALFLDDALAMFRDRGWQLIDAEPAFTDPVFLRQPLIAPAGNSLVWQLAKERGGFEGRLRNPGEDDVYEKPAMDMLGL